MTRPSIVSLFTCFTCSFVSGALLITGQATAQGTMTPTQPPATQATPTPNQPPPALPPPAQPPATQPATAAPAAAGTTEPPPEEKGPGDAPKARTGFQLALRTGIAIPLGKAEDTTDMSDVLGPQVPLIVDIGGKIIPNLFLGGYLGLSFGGPGGKAEELCDRASVDCTGVGIRVGAQIHYHIIPDGKLNPWVGYGIGYEIAGFSGEKNGNKVTLAYGGVEFAHFMAGLDLRVSRVFGVGPFADFALGTYSKGSAEVKQGNATVLNTDGDVKETALHQWLLLGARFVFFP